MSMEQEGTHSDPAPSPEWDPRGPETGLEEPMWQLGIEQPLPYPERPGEPDCIYYLRTGFCGYAHRCRFNHPRNRSTSVVVGSGRGSGGDYPVRVDQPICQYYMRTGTCKFGTSCKYHHPRQDTSSMSPFAFNIYGYPLRPGEKECTYYIKTGQCKFGMTCKFHHPHPTNVSVPAATPAAPPTPLAAPTVYTSPSPNPQQYGVVTGQWPFARPSMVPGSYIQGPYGPMLLTPGVVPFPGWAPYLGTTPVTTPNTQSVGTGQFYGLMPLSPSAPAYTGPYQEIPSSIGAPSNIPKGHSYPQRPGQPECQHYLKTGDCKFGSTCKYHHPTEWVVPETSSTLSPMGLPLRPGTPTCSYYAQHGVCKFGPTCKFDHPTGSLRYSPSASSLYDMPVAPYPVGSSIGTLAPSSSSDLRAEMTISGPNKDSSATLSTSVSISNGSGGSVLSKSGPISQSGLQQSSQSSATSSSVKGSSAQGGTPR